MQQNPALHFLSQLRCRTGASLFLLCLAVTLGGFGQLPTVPGVVPLGLLLPSAPAHAAQKPNQKIRHNVGLSLFRVAGIGPKLIDGHAEYALLGFRIDVLHLLLNPLFGLSPIVGLNVAIDSGGDSDVLANLPGQLK